MAWAPPRQWRAPPGGTAGTWRSRGGAVRAAGGDRARLGARLRAIYGLYNGKFEGTTSDALTVFFAAFAADLTAEGVAQAAKTFQPGGATIGQ
jgi:hypothetical protein